MEVLIIIAVILDYICLLSLQLMKQIKVVTRTRDHPSSPKPTNYDNKKILNLHQITVLEEEPSQK